MILEALKIVGSSLGSRSNAELFESDLDVDFLRDILSDLTLQTLAEVGYTFNMCFDFA